MDKESWEQILHNEEIHNLYRSHNIVRKLQWTRHAIWTMQVRNLYKICLVEKPLRNYLLERQRRLGDNIQMDLMETGCGG
jgi:hypothetical protein